MEKSLLLYIVLTYLLKESEESHRGKHAKKKSIKRKKTSLNDEDSSVTLGTKNISYVVNPKKFLNYVEQFSRIKSLGEEFRCKLHGSCPEDLKRFSISRKTKQGKAAKAAKKSMQSFSSLNVPDNANQIIQPDRLISPISPSFMGGPSYSNQPNAAEFGQQPQMNLKIPKIPEGMALPGMQPGMPGMPSLDQIQNAANDASIQNSIQSKMAFMDSANPPMMSMQGMQGGPGTLGPGGGPPGAPGAGEGAPGEGITSEVDLRPGAPAGHASPFARHHPLRKEKGRMGNNHHDPGGEGSQMSDDGKEDERIRVNGPPRGVANSDTSSVSDEDIYKAESVQPNEMKDLHNFLSRDHKFKPKDEEEESQREDEEFNERERGGQHGDNRNGGNDISDERDEAGDRDYRGENRSPDKDEGEEEDHGRPSNDREDLDREAEDKHHASHHHGGEPGPEGPGEPMGPMGGGEMGPGAPMMGQGGPSSFLKPGGPEVPTLNNLIGGSMPGPIPGMEDQAMAPPRVHQYDGDNQARFISENQRNMMESNSDYDVPKTAFASLWKDYMLTTQSQLADKDPSANNREMIHHPHQHQHHLHHLRRKSKVRQSGKEIHRWKKSNVDDGEPPMKRSEGSTPEANGTVDHLLSQANGTATTAFALSNGTAEPSTNATINNATVATNATTNTDISNSTVIPQSNATLSNSTLEIKNDTKAAKKSVVKKPYELPPIYLTERNGEKLLVVHPTAEFIKSLPRINFTDSDNDELALKRTIVTPAKASLIKTSTNRDDYEDDNNEDEDEEEEESNDESESGADENPNIVARSNIYGNSPKQGFISIPVFSPDPNGKIGNWLRAGRDKIYTGNTAQIPRSFDGQNFPNPLINKAYSDFDQSARVAQNGYDDGSRKGFFNKAQPEGSVPVPKEIQNLYQQYAPGDGKSNFQYAPSQDEVSEELRYVQNNGNNENTGEREDSNGGQITPSSPVDSPMSPENEFASHGSEPDSAPISPIRDPSWDREGEMRPAEGTKRSGLPIIFTKEHVGFGPIIVEAKTADAPPDDTALDE